ncbi:hypothetical protein SAMD00023353_3600620 [Rosellinia necatrix]|uniref:Uncharacterized protein n=1 Tax=Rosellinia necatrix TaxID=77044 RepID=A0A1W2TN32_ROSNE|nr:hypothetical protein SAMD00023353_3600620 [Rosellinia necatrix]
MNKNQAKALVHSNMPLSVATATLKVILYRLSNNKYYFSDNRAQQLHDKFVLRFVEAVSRSNPEVLQAILTGKYATTCVIKKAIYACAIRGKHYDMVSRPLRSGVDPDYPVPHQPGSRMVQSKLERGQVRLSVEFYTTWRGLSGLEEAAFGCDTRLGDILLRAAADANHTSRPPPMSPLTVAAFASGWPGKLGGAVGDVATASKLVDLRLNLYADINSDWQLGITLLMATAWNPDTAIAEVWLRSSSHVGPAREDTIMETSTPCPIDIAAYHGVTALVRLLMDNGSDCNIRMRESTRTKGVSCPYSWLVPTHEFSTTVQFALASGNPETASFLLLRSDFLIGGLVQAIYLGNDLLTKEVGLT